MRAGAPQGPLRVALKRGERRSRLSCTRADGSYTSADLGPGLPQHDLAHFVVERALGLRRGFYGNLARGYSIQALTRKSVIQTLGAETWQAEIAARALQALCAGGCRLEQIQELGARFARLEEGEALELWFDVAAQP